MGPPRPAIAPGRPALVVLGVVVAVQLSQALAFTVSPPQPLAQRLGVHGKVMATSSVADSTTFVSGYQIAPGVGACGLVAVCYLSFRKASRSTRIANKKFWRKFHRGNNRDNLINYKRKATLRMLEVKRRRIALGLAIAGEAYADIEQSEMATETLTATDPQAVLGKANKAATKFIDPAVWNKTPVRVGALLLAGGAVGQAVPFVRMLHLAAFGTWFGAQVWTTFFAGLTMFKNLPRQTFGKLQAKLFPQYFQLGTFCTVAVVLTGARVGLPMGPALFSLAFTLTNLLYLEPESTRVMFERYEAEKRGDKDAQKAAAKSFGKMHGISSLSNLMALMGLVAHGSLIAARL